MNVNDDVHEPLNPYSRLFMIMWALAAVLIAGFRTGDDRSGMTKNETADGMAYKASFCRQSPDSGRMKPDFNALYAPCAANGKE